MTTYITTNQTNLITSAFKALIATDALSTISVLCSFVKPNTIVSSAVDNAWQILMQQAGFQTLCSTCASYGFKTMGFVYGASGSYVAGINGLQGILVNTSNPSVPSVADLYLYTSVGLSIGLSEGVGGFHGLYLYTDVPLNSGGGSSSAQFSAAAGLGAAVALSTPATVVSVLEDVSGFAGLAVKLITNEVDPNNNYGLTFMVVTGEDISVDYGASYSKVNQFS